MGWKSGVEDSNGDLWDGRTVWKTVGSTVRSESGVEDSGVGYVGWETNRLTHL